MRAHRVWLFLASFMSCLHLCAQSTTVLTNQYVQGSGNYNSYLIATLPANTAGDYDHLHIMATLNSNWFGFANSSIDAIFSNRSNAGFSYLYTVKGARVSENARLAAYQNPDGTVGIYMIFSPGYTTGTYTILENLQENVSSAPVNLQLQTPPGTLVFDTANPLYPPATTLDFTGVFEVDGDVSVDGQLFVGSANGGLYGDSVNTVIQGPQNVYLAPVNVAGTHVSMADGSVHIGDISAQPNAKLVFADGSVQSTAAVQDVNSSNGVTTITNNEGTAGIQIASSSQSVGGIFGPGGNLNLEANSVTDTTDTGGLIQLLGSQHGNGLNSQTYIFGNYSLVTGMTRVGLLVDGQDHGQGIQNNVGIGLQLGSIPGSPLQVNGNTIPSAALEVNGSMRLTIGSGASITFADGTVQSTAWNGVLFGGDYAESVDVSGDREEYEAGDVLVIDPDCEGKFLKSFEPYSTAVTGIYSTKPGVVGRRQLTARAHMKEEVPMAMTGVVPTKVSAENGPIKPGDLLVTSSKPGYAMRGTDRTQMLGAVVGKAIGHLDIGLGTIEAVVTLQ